MRLNHVNLTVSDVPAAVAFFERYFGLRDMGIQNSEAEVDALYARMRGDGIVADPPRRSHGWTFYVTAPGGVLVEVLA